MFFFQYGSDHSSTRFWFSFWFLRCVEPIDERIHEFIMSDITCCILDATPVIFGTVKEGIMELLDNQLGSFHVEITAIQFGALTLSF